MKTYQIYFCLEARNQHGRLWGQYRADSATEALEKFYADTRDYRDENFEARELTR